MKNYISDILIFSVRNCSDIATYKTICGKCDSVIFRNLLGSVKKFLFNTLLNYTREMGHKTIPVAYTGIINILLQGRRTANSQFKLLFPIFDGSASKNR